MALYSAGIAAGASMAKTVCSAAMAPSPTATEACISLLSARVAMVARMHGIMQPTMKPITSVAAAANRQQPQRAHACI